ncbi:retrovirus-related pol polyprotein from transposon RE1 [Citrus sinensis]|uniref:Retrovirus-related pol polyprotein from transposon RE1 n=1 Tax=Citrus sinensis TaxID=2711 RepID=A0ACB8KDS1_CITSI|nr:retrovirus-related pol polyprotein from transposon RE1 [Citrus sinensis]
MSNWNNNSMMNAYYAQIRGHTRRGGYTGGVQGNYNGHSGGRNGMFNGRGMFLNSHPRGFPAGTGHFGNQGRNQMMMGSNRFGSSGRGSFGSTGFNGTGNLPPFESQVSNSDDSMNTCQICFKVGHTAVECWHRFEENYIPQSPRQFQKGKGSKSAYIANYEPAYIPYYPTNDNPWSVNNNGLHMSQSGYPCASNNSGMPWVGTASAAYCEGPADEGWYLDSGATHHLTNSMGNLNIRDEFRGNEKLIIGNGEGPTQIPLPSQSQITSNNIQHVQNNHPMTTRGKAGIFKPKMYTAVLVHKEPDSVGEALQDTNWFTAMKNEYDALIENRTWSLVPRTENQKVVGNKWVYRIKYNTDGSVAKYKARLVAKGFQQIEGVNYFDTFSPMVKLATVRVVLSLAVMNQWIVRQVDVNNAFLNGELSEEVFMQQPEGFVDKSKSNYVCRLHKALYGLKQAPRAWFEKLRGCLLQWGFRNSKSDSSLFLRKTKVSLIMVLIYVDDILVTGPNSEELDSFIQQFNIVFALKDLGRLSYFLGIEVLYGQDCIYLSQKKYIRDLLAKVDMLECKGVTTPMCSGKDSKLQKVVKGELGYYVEDATHYRSIVGGLQYLILTRPEIAYSVHKLSQYVSAPTMQHLMACKRVLKYLKETQDYGLKFVKDGDLKITAFTDADWGSDLDDRKSIGAYCVYLGNNLISWSSNKQTVVTKSSAESEYRALASAASEIAWLKSLFLEMEVYCVERPTIWCDNISATELAKNPVFHSRTKHIEIDVHFIRDKVLSGDLKICYVPSEDQIADILTKPLSSPQFNYLRDKLNVCSCPLSLRGAVKIAHCAEVRKKSQRIKLPAVICATS